MPNPAYHRYPRAPCPVIFREPSVNLGLGSWGKPPHLVGDAFRHRFGIDPDSADAYAFTSLDFEKPQAGRQGRSGGFAHLKTLIDCCEEAVTAGTLAAARRRRYSGKARADQTPRGRRHDRSRQFARHRGDDRAFEFTYGEETFAGTLIASMASFSRKMFSSPKRRPSATPGFRPASAPRVQRPL